MTIPRNLSKLAPGANTSGVLGPTFGGTGLTSPGATGNVLTSDGTNWTSAAPSGGGGGGTVTAVASGTLPNGAPVIVNSDGTVSAVTGVSIPQSVGSAATFNAANTTWVTSAYDSVNQKVVIVYADAGNSNYGTAVVGTISGTTISFGAEYVFISNSVSYLSACYDSSNGKIVIAYANVTNFNFGTAIVGTVSGTSISFGSPVAFVAAGVYYVSCTYDSTHSKVVIAYADASNNYFGTAIVGTVSGTSISFGTSVLFNSTGTATQIGITFDTAQGKVCIAYEDGANSYFGYASIGTVSGTSISFGSRVQFFNQVTSFCSCAYDSINGKIIIAFQGPSGSLYGYAVVGTISGTSITFGSPVIFSSTSIAYTACAYSPAAGKVLITYQDNGNAGYLTAIVGTVSGTSISFGSPVVINSGSTTYNTCVYNNSSQNIAVGYSDGSSAGKSAVFQMAGLSTNLTSQNFIGFSTAGYTNGQTATIGVVGSTSTAQSGLTAATKYYVQYTGTLATTADSVVGSVYAGVALSATNLLIKG